MTADELAAREDMDPDFGLCPRCSREMDGPYAVCVLCSLRDAQAEYQAAITRAAERIGSMDVEDIVATYREIGIGQQKDAA